MDSWIFWCTYVRRHSYGSRYVHESFLHPSGIRELRQTGTPRRVHPSLLIPSQKSIDRLTTFLRGRVCVSRGTVSNLLNIQEPLILLETGY